MYFGNVSLPSGNVPLPNGSDPLPNGNVPLPFFAQLREQPELVR